MRRTEDEAAEGGEGEEGRILLCLFGLEAPIMRKVLGVGGEGVLLFGGERQEGEKEGEGE